MNIVQFELYENLGRFFKFNSWQPWTQKANEERIYILSRGTDKPGTVAVADVTS